MRLVHSCLAVAFATLAFASSTAFADTFNFSFAGPGTSGSGQITASPTATPGTYTVTGISGLTDGAMITGLAALGTLGSDDVLFVPPTAQGYFDIAGITYLLNGGTEVNLYSFDGSEDVAVGTSLLNLQFTTLSSFTLAPAAVATPEPNSLSLFAISVLSLIAAMRLRRPPCEAPQG